MNIMYNENTKKRYIEEKTEQTIINKYFLPNLFKKSEQFEENLNKDVCNFTKVEIADMLKLMGFSSLESVRVIVSGYSLYTDWCMAHGLVEDAQNHFREFDSNSLTDLLNANLRQLKITDRQQIMEWLSQLYNPSDKFLILAIFEGIKGKDFNELYNLTIDDIDINNHTINVVGKGKMKVSKELCNIALESYETNEFYPMAGEMKRQGTFIPSDKIIKDYPNVKVDADDFRKGRRLYARILRCMRYLGIDSYFDSNTLINSGIVDMVKRESERLGITNAEYVDNHLDDINKRYGKNFTKKTFINKLGDYLR